MRQPVEVHLWRRGDRDGGDPGDLGGDHVHDHARGEGGETTGHVQTDPTDRDHPLGDDSTRRQLDRGGRLAELGGTDPAATVDGHLEGGPDLGVELLDRGGELGGRDPELVGHDVVEPVRPVPQGAHPAGGDVVADGTHHLHGGFHVELGPRHDGRVVQLLAGGEPVS